MSMRYSENSPGSLAKLSRQPGKVLLMQSIFDAAGGSEGNRRLAEAWHRRATGDEMVAHAFSHGYRDDHVERLAAYWGEALGGPAA